MKKKKRKKKNGETMKIVWFFLSRYKLFFVFIIGLAAIIGILESISVGIIYPITEIALSGEVDPNSNPIIGYIEPMKRLIPIDSDLMCYGVLFIVVAVIVFLIKTFYFYLSVKFMAKIVQEVKQDVFNTCMNSDYQFFIDNKQGEILYKTSDAPNSISGLISALSDIFVQLFLLIAVFSLLAAMSWKLVVLMILGGIGYYYVTKYLSTVVSYKAGIKQRESGQKEKVILTEYTSGIKQIKVFETFPYWQKMYDVTLKKFWFYHRKNYFWMRFPEIALWLVLYITIGSTIIFISWQYPGNFMDIIPLVASFAFGTFLLLPKISKFGQYRMKFMNLLPNVEAVYELLKDKSYSTIKNGTKEFTGLKSHIEFKDIYFSHKNRDILLDHFSLDIKKDKVTALVGPSGSGKSTIVYLLLRLHDVVEDGGLYIDDVNIKEYDIYSFLRKVGFVSQDTFIYNSSIRNNIAFGSEYTDEEIIEAARYANADEFIMNLPDGCNTIVGDRGMRLSGGEKQRIAIARAMIRKPEFLILDEATSSLDNISENVVQQAINKVSKSCTTFIIAHRLSTIQNADVIHVLDKGKIVESGTHKELLRKKGKYYELYNIQRHKDEKKEE